MENNNRKDLIGNNDIDNIVLDLLAKIQSKCDIQIAANSLCEHFRNGMDRNIIKNILIKLAKKIKENTELDDIQKTKLVNKVFEIIRIFVLKNNTVRNNMLSVFYEELVSGISGQCPVETVIVFTRSYCFKNNKDYYIQNTISNIIKNNLDLVNDTISAFLNTCLSSNYDSEKKEKLLVEVLSNIINENTMCSYAVITASLKSCLSEDYNETKCHVIQTVIAMFLENIELNLEDKQEVEFEMFNTFLNAYYTEYNEKKKQKAKDLVETIASNIAFGIIQNIFQSTNLSSKQKKNLIFRSVTNIALMCKINCRHSGYVSVIMNGLLQNVEEDMSLNRAEKLSLAYQIVKNFSKAYYGISKLKKRTIMTNLMPSLIRCHKNLASEIIHGFSAVYARSDDSEQQDTFKIVMYCIMGLFSNAFIVDNSIIPNLANINFEIFDLFSKVENEKFKKYTMFCLTLSFTKYLQKVLFSKDKNCRNYNIESAFSKIFGCEFDKLKISPFVDEWIEYFKEKIKNNRIDGFDFVQILPYVFELLPKECTVKDLFNLLERGKFNNFYYFDTRLENKAEQFKLLKNECADNNNTCIVCEKSNNYGFIIHAISGDKDIIVDYKPVQRNGQQFTENFENKISYLKAGIAFKVILENYLFRENTGSLEEVLAYLDEQRADGQSRFEFEMNRRVENFGFKLVRNSQNELQNQAANPFEMLNEITTCQQLQGIADRRFGRSEQQVMELPENANLLEERDDALSDEVILQQLMEIFEMGNSKFEEPMPQVIHAVRVLDRNKNIQNTQNNIMSQMMNDLFPRQQDIQVILPEQQNIPQVQNTQVNFVQTLLPEQPTVQVQNSQVSLQEQQNVQTLLPEQQNNNVVQNENEDMQPVEVQQNNKFSQPLPKSPNSQFVETRVLLRKTEDKINQRAISLRWNEKKLNEAKRVEKFGITDKNKAIYETNIRDLIKELNVLEEERRELKKKLEDIRSPEKTSKRRKWSDKQARNGSFDSNNEHSNSESSMSM